MWVMLASAIYEQVMVPSRPETQVLVYNILGKQVSFPLGLKS